MSSEPIPPANLVAWRKTERTRQIAHRAELSADQRSAQTVAMVQRLAVLVRALTAAPRTTTTVPTATTNAETIISLYWPIRAEPDLRPWMEALHARGVRVALSIATALHQPLTFREWRPHAPMAHGLWNIPYPAEGQTLTPTMIIAPVVAFDPQCFRLGYGGGFFDRTLAMMTPKPITIGVGYDGCAIPTIYPQSHDIALDFIVTARSTFDRARTANAGHL